MTFLRAALALPLLVPVAACGTQRTGADRTLADSGPAAQGDPAEGIDGSSGPGVSSDGSTGPSGPPAGGDGSADGGGSGGPVVPTGLLTDLLRHPELTVLTDVTPKFGWIVGAARPNERQTAFRILIASQAALLDTDLGDMWDSGKTISNASINVPYGGQSLAAGASYFWKVRTWDSADQPSAWSAPQNFVMAPTLGAYATATEPQVQTRIAPTQLTAVGSGHFFVDFGRDAFGWVELTLDALADGAILSVGIGEHAVGQGVDQNPGGSIRHAMVQLTLQKGLHTYRVATPPDTLNTNPPAIPLPAPLGVVMPFRYVEVVNAHVTLAADMVRQVAVRYPSDDTASSFHSSDATLNQVWDLSKYSVIAPTFAGTYIDGDRERTPYEADAYIQLLGHYSIDREFAIGRASHEYLLVHPTWPTEWKQHSVMMAWTDWMYTGNTDSLAQWYSTITAQKTLEQYAGADGLLNTQSLRDLIDWPVGERDGFVLTGVNSVVNAFYYHNLLQMADIAGALGKASDAARYRTMAAQVMTTFNAKLSDATTGLYVDGVGQTHSSLHANMFPLAFGLVPADRKAKVVAFVKSRGMACSVYGAQYLLEALYQAGEPDAALSLLTSTTDRSWTNMIRVGSTITLEAWDAKYKPNLDWNHAWATAPANMVARYIVGVQPAAPGFAVAAIRPQLGSLSQAEALVPTIRGPIHVALTGGAGQPYIMDLEIPANMTANVAVPATASVACSPLLDGLAAQVTARDGFSWVDGVGSGPHEIRCR